MPTLSENKAYWGDPENWSRDGDHWSAAWGSPAAQWHGAIYPRCFAYLRGRILEIATGQGRWTQFLRTHADSLIGVDVSGVCTRRCRERFAGDPRLRFEVNDGLTLPMVEDGSIDFAFSFDSLVHADGDVIESYTRELARVLRPGAVAFIHHSNVEDVRWPLASLVKQKIMRKPIECGWRTSSMGARRMRRFAQDAGISCVQQELTTWLGASELIDCMSTLVNRPATLPCHTFANRGFMDEADSIRRAVELARSPAESSPA
jgi:SAM-dependent methyltransferase